MNTDNIAQLPVEHKVICDELRHYLAAMEAIAHHGATADDPAEVMAAVQCFVRPSDALRRLAENSTKVF